MTCTNGEGGMSEEQYRRIEEKERRLAEQRLQAEAAREFGTSPMMPPPFIHPAAFEPTRNHGLTPEQERMRDAITTITRLSRNLRNAGAASMVTLGVALGGIMCANAWVFMYGAAGMAASFLYTRWCVVRIRSTELGPRTREG